MNERKGGLVSFIQRTFSNEAISIKIYIAWGIVTLVVFGFLGVLSISKTFLTNAKLLDDLYTNNLKLENKVEELKVSKERVDLVGGDADILDEFLPDEFQPQDYLVNLSVISGKSGYFLDSVIFQEVGESEVNMSLRLSGKGNTKDIIRDLETSKKLNEIKDIDFSVGDREDSLNISIKSFMMDK